MNAQGVYFEVWIVISIVDYFLFKSSLAWCAVTLQPTKLNSFLGGTLGILGVSGSSWWFLGVPGGLYHQENRTAGFFVSNPVFDLKN